MTKALPPESEMVRALIGAGEAVADRPPAEQVDELCRRAEGPVRSPRRDLLRLCKRLRGLVALLFPRLPRLARWGLRHVSRREQHLGRDGYTDLTRQEISVSRWTTRPDADPVAVDLLLVHELTHATGRVGHGRVFSRRLAAAGRRARTLGMCALADRIEAEVAQHEEGLSARAG